eukprot:3895258-Rhodomonas_salina.1
MAARNGQHFGCRNLIFFGAAAARLWEGGVRQGRKFVGKQSPPLEAVIARGSRRAEEEVLGEHHAG